VAFNPELEEVLVPAWARVQQILEQRRNRCVSRADILRFADLSGRGFSEETWSQALQTHPKECLVGLLRALNLRHHPALFGELGRALSLTQIKQGASAARIVDFLLQRFGRR